MKYGQLFLIPTPLQLDLDLTLEAKKLLTKIDLESGVVLLVETPKEARRILKSEFRHLFDLMESFSRKTEEEELARWLSHLKQGKDLYLMSDGGYPAFCDPGTQLVRMAHEAGVLISMPPQSSSLMMALAMSGFTTDPFVFQGFLPRDASERKMALEKLKKEKRTQALFETPYRFKKIWGELNELTPDRHVFLITELASATMQYWWGPMKEIYSKVHFEKGEFVIVIDQDEKRRSH